MMKSSTKKIKIKHFSTEARDLFRMTYNEIMPYIEKLKLNVKVDFENFDARKTLEVGNMSFINVNAGGDWEEPVTLLIYRDSNDKWGAYIPFSENTYCLKTNTALGSCECCEADRDRKPNPGKMRQELQDKFEHDGTDFDLRVD